MSKRGCRVDSEHILGRMNQVLDELIDTAQTLKNLSEQVISEEQLIPLQNKQELEFRNCRSWTQTTIFTCKPKRDYLCKRRSTEKSKSFKISILALFKIFPIVKD